VHFREKLTLEKVAKAHNISISKLKRIFRESTETSVVAHLTALRIKEAKRLIREGKHSFSQIAENVGFESIHYFSTVFKKHTGMTPSDYARSLRAK
jgi:AraC-like DNA-binding protein